MRTQEMRGRPLLRGGERFGSLPHWFARLFSPQIETLVDTFDRGFAYGSLNAQLPDGTRRALGGRSTGFDADIRLNDWRALFRLVTNGSIGWYQAYEAGEWESDDPASLFALFSHNARSLGDMGRSYGPFRWGGKIAHAINRNTRVGSARNIAAHYDLGNDFYKAWLDPTMTYSSALDLTEHKLEPAQHTKLAALVERVDDAQRVLEIGCGWGSLAQKLADAGKTVTAISLSEEQLTYARKHRSETIDFRKQDYRDVENEFDGIVSCEMIEALGREYWPVFLDCIAASLKPGGRAAIQYISMADDLFEAYAASADFIQAYVFPGGLLIKSSEFRTLAENRGLAWRDQTDFGHDYARTLQIWRKSFDDAVRTGGLPAGFDDRFVRLWRYYLDYCEGGFLAGNVNVHQVTLVKN